MNKRQTGTGNNGLLKLATPTSGSGNGPESLPVRPLINQFNKDNNNPERRHSSYDPSAANGKSARVSCRTASANGSTAAQQTSAININGLPDPFNSSRINPSSVYSSQESLHRGTSGNNGTPLRPNSSTGM